ncbi:MAG: ammonia channel protein [Dehalococcoidia bacterium]|nr:ammonia channel protein [Chloroflexota bacterium]MBR92299.1 ammonia channel protein [Dehalococcoidia bacterium]MQG09698.1 ammonium transporter [SAR202 cluster bacterium]|tara:strand:+ start:1022 stop:2248 length:1227 start_codon:yes stop_codon:yes gene_type:complete
MDSGHTAWMLTASALVFFMTPGLAFFYGGLVRAKSLVNTIMLSFITIGVVSIVWTLWGYSLAYGNGELIDGFIGDFSLLGLSGVEMFSQEGDAISPLYDVLFQMMFAIITPALITGAFVERFKFSTYLVFTVIWITIVYAPVAHWVWGGGWIGADGAGALDFAGGTVIHINAGAAAVAAALLVGRRKLPGLQPNNVPYIVLGASILWFGWFGFNGGSALASDDYAVNAMLVTQIAAGTAATTWGILSMISSGKISAVGTATGAVAGLVAITPAAGAVNPIGALAIGFGAGLICYYAVELIHKTKLDDALDVFAVHGVGGLWGCIATGIFAIESIAGVKGVVQGEFDQVWIQIYTALGTLAYSFVLTYGILYILDKIPVLGLRVSDSSEDQGLDLSEHGEQSSIEDGAN